MKKIILFSFLIFPFSFLIVSCHCKKKITSAAATTTSTATTTPTNANMSDEEIKKTQEQQKSFANGGYSRARVIYNNLDGCGYMIQLGDGKKLEPSKPLADEFKKDNLDVWVKYATKKGGMSVCMAGEMADITDIHLRK